MFFSDSKREVSNFLLEDVDMIIGITNNLVKSKYYFFCGAFKVLFAQLLHS